MTLKKCTSCNKVLTTKNTVFKGRDDVALYFNCTHIINGQKCDSTVILRSKNWKAILMKAGA